MVAYAPALAAARARVATGSTPSSTRHGAMEYAIAGEGPPILMIHGTGGGFDQGLALRPRPGRGRLPGHRAVALRLPPLGDAGRPVVGGPGRRLRRPPRRARHRPGCRWSAARRARCRRWPSPSATPTAAPRWWRWCRPPMRRTARSAPPPGALTELHHHPRPPLRFPVLARSRHGRERHDRRAARHRSGAGRGGKPRGAGAGACDPVGHPAGQRPGRRPPQRRAPLRQPAPMPLDYDPRPDPRHLARGRPLRHHRRRPLHRGRGARARSCVTWPTGGHIWIGHDADVAAGIDAFLRGL